jgi:signal transduction histidine kinase
MTPGASRTSVHYVLAAIWLIYTISLAAWWLSVGLTMADRRTMFLMEGATFIIVLIAGGLALIIGIRREQRRRQALETFFMAFTHDLKTSLASVQLQAEGIREDWPAGSDTRALDRLLHDTVRLQIQLENSLFVAQPDGRLLGERVDLAAAVQRMAHDWPELQVRVEGTATATADARAFEAVGRNVFQNAVIHGRATEVAATIERPVPGRVRLVIEDNGAGLPESALPALGQPFARPGETSGTGVGLFVCRRLVQRMNGTMTFARSASGRGLRVAIDLPEAA